MARRGDWVPCVGWGTLIQHPAADPPSSIILVVPRDTSVGAQGEIGTVETQDSVLAMRVVGQVKIALGDQGTSGITTVVERIRVGLYDDVGAVAFYADDFFDASEANEPFLWQRVSVFEVTADTNMSVGTGAHPAFSMIDVRVSRRLDREQGLFYSLHVQNPGGDSRIDFQPFLRTFAR